MLNFTQPEIEKLEECTELYLKAFASPPWYEDNDAGEVREYIRSFMNVADRKFFALSIDEKIIAIAFCNIVPCVGRPFMRIEDCCIDPAYIRLGLGSKFLGFMQEEAKKNGCNCILCATVKDSPAQFFYNKNGFSELENSIYLYKEI